MILVDIQLGNNDHNKGELENSPRRRQLENWKVRGYQANDPSITIYRLVGMTTREADGYEPAMRVTQTSPIAACEGNKITTASGSIYWLGEPHPDQEIYSPDQFIADEYLNKWIEGKNWLTI